MDFLQWHGWMALARLVPVCSGAGALGSAGCSLGCSAGSPVVRLASEGLLAGASVACAHVFDYQEQCWASKASLHGGSCPSP